MKIIYLCIPDNDIFWDISRRLEKYRNCTVNTVIYLFLNSCDLELLYEFWYMKDLSDL
jgi:hypothetical protein